MTDNTTTTAILKLDDVSYAYTKGGKKVLKNISHHRAIRRRQDHDAVVDLGTDQSHGGPGPLQR